MDPKAAFEKVLAEAVNFSFSPLVEQDEHFKELEPHASPLTFYDRHINSNLICRNLKDFASLGPTLSKVFDDAIAKFYNDGYKISRKAAFVHYNTTSVQDARSINALYGREPGNFVHHLPSIFYFHPEGVVWDSVFFHRKDPGPATNNFTFECSLEVIYRHEGGIERFDKLSPVITDATAKKLQDMRENYPPLANWLFCAMTPAGKSIIKQMQGSRPFRWEASRTLGIKNLSFAAPPLDAENGVLHRARILPKRHNKMKAKGRTKDKGVPKHETTEISSPLAQKKSAYVTVSRRPVKSVRHYLDPHQYIQHAWARAAKQDSTFMVFSCGIYERIGVRHRESQTLYLSPLIETINSRNPPYGKLHLGLHTAIVQDFLERYERDNQKGGKKRSAEHFDNEDFPKAKRVKIPLPALSADEIKPLLREMNKRELALVTLNYGPYFSPVPASFLRCGSSCIPNLYQPFKQSNRSKFSLTQYFELVLGEPLGKGAVGVVHSASLSLALESGETVRHNIVIKLAFLEEQKSKLENEFEMYTILACAEEPVEGIVMVHGLFEDPESGALALFMENGGQSLRELNKEQPDRDERLQKEEREACIRALNSIHKAGVRHRDLRPDNILISRDPALKVSIIDFDSAFRENRAPKFAKEIKCLQAIFNGEDFTWWHS